MNKIKIAHIITDLNIGGAEIMLLKTLRNFKNKRFEHLVISLKDGGNIGRAIEKEGFRVYTLNSNKYNFVPSFAKLISILKRERPKIVHSYLFHADIFGRITARIAHIPIVISSLRSVEVGGRWREALLKLTGFCVDKITAVSQNVADTHILRGTARKEKLCVIYNGLEVENGQAADAFPIRHDMGIKEEEFLLLTVGRLEAVKGHIYLFDAVRTLRDKGYRVRLIIIGGGRGRSKVEGEIIKRNIEDKVILAGEREDIGKFFRASDAFILPSLWEGMPNTLLEAMAAGLPVIATRVGGIPEVVTDNKTGLLVEPKDSDALAKAIECIMKESELRKRLALNAKDYAIKNFDIKKTVSETERLYEELLKKHEKD